MSYALSIKTDQIKYATAVSLLTESIQKILIHSVSLNPLCRSYCRWKNGAQGCTLDLDKVYREKHYDGNTDWSVNELQLFRLYNNHVDCQSLPGDANSKLTFNQLTADWSDITLTSCQLEITNLLHPFLYAIFNHRLN